jgi:arylsulfatase A-like enzyme
LRLETVTQNFQWLETIAAITSKDWNLSGTERANMKRVISRLAALLLAPLGLLAQKAPNFVVILGEGHGWSSTSVQMDESIAQSKSAFVRTPNLETLAKDGMRFAEFYAASPRCTPSRAAIFTGRNPAELHMTFVNEGKRENDSAANGRVTPPSSLMDMPADAVTIGALLKDSGYATAHFGKWHVGRANPNEHGFDESDGATNNGGPDDVENPHPKELYGMTERGIDFMARQVKAGKPFYLQLSHYASRRGGDASSNAIATVKSWGLNLDARELGEAAADADLDIALGQLLKNLDELGIATNTFVMFTTDHGTPGKNPPFAGGKGTVSEGGLRVPFIARGPGIVAGACSHVRAFHEDLFPTIAALANISAPLPKRIEGGSLADVLTHEGKGTVRRPREEFVVHFPHYDKDEIGPASAIYLGNFKLVRVYETGALRLFDLSKDITERHDLAQQMPDKAADLDRRLTEYLKTINAQMPTPNANYDPTKTPALGLKDKGGGKRDRHPLRDQ